MSFPGKPDKSGRWFAEYPLIPPKWFVDQWNAFYPGRRDATNLDSRVRMAWYSWAQPAKISDESAIVVDELYIIGVVLGDPWCGVVKVGHAAESFKRLRTLQSGCPLPLKLLHVEPEAGQFEVALHESLDSFRYRGEWFNFGLMDPVQEILKRLGKIRYHFD